MRLVFILFINLIFYSYSFAQILINEASSNNFNWISDEDGDYPDWIELYNAGSISVNLSNYKLSDNPSLPNQWNLPSTIIPPSGFVTIFCSGKNRSPITGVHHWENAVSANGSWSYIEPTSAPASNWNTLSYSDASWGIGTGGFGFGDGDDITITNSSNISVFVRKIFNVSDTSAIIAGILNVDYDDGFVAYLNGIEIARSNMTSTAWNDPASASHEAVMYTGGVPEYFNINQTTFKNALRLGNNVLAIQFHNQSTSSSDLTSLAWLQLGIGNASSYFSSTPSWFTAPVSSGNLHTNFKINNQGETIYLYNNIGSLINSINVPTLSENASIGLQTDGSSTVSIFLSPTFGSTNNTSTPYSGYNSPPTFSKIAGFYTGSQIISLSSSAGTSIRYTINGDEPSAASTLYTGPIVVSTSITIRAITVSASMLPSPVVTNSFIINEMDISIPTICLTTDSLSLWSLSSGIYIGQAQPDLPAPWTIPQFEGFPFFSSNHWQNWEKKAYVEYFDASHSQQFEQQVGIEIDGNWSRGYPQRSFKVKCNDGPYGKSTVNYPLIPQKSYLSDYETFYLRNGGTTWGGIPQRDALQQLWVKNTNNIISAETHVAVFLNGMFWGVYELREKQNKYYIEDNFGVDDTKIDFIANGVVKAGSDTGYTNLKNWVGSYPTPNAPSFESAFKNAVSIENFQDYFATEIFYNNNDWIGGWVNNWKVWRTNSPIGKWQYVLMDLDGGAGGWTGPCDNKLNEILNHWSQDAIMFQKMCQNTTMRNQFINRYADMMNSTWNSSATTPPKDYLKNTMSYMMHRWYQKWYNVDTTSWKNQLDGMVTWVNDRIPCARNHVQSEFGLSGQVNITLNVYPANAGVIKINSITPVAPWTGVYFNGVPVSITAIPNPGYTFNSWTANAMLPAGTTTTASIPYVNVTSSTIFQANFTGSPSTPSITISEVNYSNDPTISSGDWIELWNYGASPVILSGWKIHDSNPANAFTIPSYVLGPNARLVLVNDIAKFTTRNPGVSNYMGPIAFSLNNTTDIIQLFDATGALVQSMTYIDSLPWPRSADGYGRTLELTGTNPVALASSWFDGCIGGSPGVAYTPCNNSIIISEINYNSDTLFNTNDWIELYNNAGSTIDLSGWMFKDKVDTNIYTIPNGTLLGSGQYLVLVQDTNTFRCLHSGVNNYIGPFVYNLSGNGEPLRLFNSLGVLQYSMIYDDNAALNWPLPPDGSGYTLEILNINGNVNDGTNWFSGCYGGSPGSMYNSTCNPVTGLNPTITGNLVACENNTYNYSIPSGPAGTTYLWSITGGIITSGTGTNSITVQWTGASTGTLSVQVIKP